MYSVDKFDRTKLKDARLRKQLSRPKLAEKAGIGASTVFRIEKLGQGNIRTLGAVCEVLSLRIEDVLLSERPRQRRTA